MAMGGEGTENGARGQQSDPRETETALGSFSLAPKQRGRQGGNKQSNREETGEGESRGREGNRGRRQGGEWRAPREVTEGAAGLRLAGSRGGDPWSPGG